LYPFRKLVCLHGDIKEAIDHSSTAKEAWTFSGKSIENIFNHDTSQKATKEFVTGECQSLIRVVVFLAQNKCERDAFIVAVLLNFIRCI
jgi:hypothetical protein